MIVDEIANFYKNSSSPNRRWFENNELKIYIRKSQRVYKDNLLFFLDIASVEAAELGKGIFTKFFNELTERMHCNFYIENVMSRRFADFFKKRGFEVLHSSELITTLVKTQ